MTEKGSRWLVRVESPSTPSAAGLTFFCETVEAAFALQAVFVQGLVSLNQVHVWHPDGVKYGKDQLFRTTLEEVHPEKWATPEEAEANKEAFHKARKAKNGPKDG